MSKNGTTPERYEAGKYVMRARQELGYNRKRFGKMLGFTDAGAKRNMQKIEGGNKAISKEKMRRVVFWLQYGLPPDAPKPNLHKAKKKYFELKRAENTPRVIVLRGK